MEYARILFNHMEYFYLFIFDVKETGKRERKGRKNKGKEI